MSFFRGVKDLLRSTTGFSASTESVDVFIESSESLAVDARTPEKKDQQQKSETDAWNLSDDEEVSYNGQWVSPSSGDYMHSGDATEQHHENPYITLLTLTYDPYYRQEYDFHDSIESQARSQIVPPDIQALDLDITKISDRLIAMGQPWRYRTEKLSRKNNIEDVSHFLSTRYCWEY